MTKKAKCLKLLQQQEKKKGANLKYATKINVIFQTDMEEFRKKKRKKITSNSICEDQSLNLLQLTMIYSLQIEQPGERILNMLVFCSYRE